MRKIFAAAIATTLIAAASVAATTAPASAGGIYVGIGGGWGGPGWGGPGWGPGWGPGYNYHGYYQPAPVIVQPQPQPYYAGGGGNLQAHIDWCSQRFQTYNPATDLYFYVPGKQRHCNSPFN